MPAEEQDGLCLEWKQLNYYVPAQEQSNYSFWNECRKQQELRILHDGKLSMCPIRSRIQITVAIRLPSCSQRSPENGRPHRHSGRLGGGQNHIAGSDFATAAW